MRLLGLHFAPRVQCRTCFSLPAAGIAEISVAPQTLETCLVPVTAGEFTNIDVTNWIGAQPPAYAATSLGSPLNFTRSWDYSLAGIVPSSSQR